MPANELDAIAEKQADQLHEKQKIGQAMDHLHGTEDVDPQLKVVLSEADQLHLMTDVHQRDDDPDN